MEQKQEFTEGKLYVISTKIYQVLVIHVCLLLAITPSILLLFFLERSIQNSSYYCLLLLPVGPALAAGFASMLLVLEGKLNFPFRDYWQKYRSNFKDAIKIWSLYVVSIVICLIDITYLNQTHFSALSWLMLFLIVLLSVFIFFAMIISVKFSFSTKDLLKLSVYYSLTNILVPLRLLSYLIIALAIMTAVSETLIFLGGSFLMWVCLRAMRPTLKAIEKNFIQKN